MESTKKKQDLQGSDLRATHAIINLTRLQQNLIAIKEKVFASKVMIIIKANAYGHGIVQVAQAMDTNADYYGVAVLEEGISLRKSGIKTPILVLGGIWGEQVPMYLKHDLSFTASSVERLEQIDAAAHAARKIARVHLKIDTGMERIGVHYYNAITLQEAAIKCKNIYVEGIFSHFANSDSADLTHARLQLERFMQVLDFYRKKDLPTPLRHFANSGAILQLPDSYFDMVRAGLLFYGLYPSKEISRSISVLPALSWKSRVVYFKVVEPNHPISYGSTWKSDHPIRVVTLPIGYGDGYFRSMSNKAFVLIRGKKYPQVGRICMDQMMINIEKDSAYNGDEVILLGEGIGGQISTEDLAEWADTIPYEILTNINTRVPRIYVTEE